MTNIRTVGLLLLCTGGIYASYLTQGVVQESLATLKFGPNERYVATSVTILHVPVGQY